MAQIWNAVWGLALMGLPGESMAQTAPFCAQLHGAMATANSDKPAKSALDITLPGRPRAAGICGFSIDMSGRHSAHCRWAFAYRAQAAMDAFSDALDALSACVDRPGPGVKDAAVNHPDSYDLRLFRHAGGTIGLSIKDKVALQKTFVMLRVTPDR